MFLTIHQPLHEQNYFNNLINVNNYTPSMKLATNTIGYYVNNYFLQKIVGDFDYINDPYSNVLTKIDEFIALNENWDGYGATPITFDAGKNAKIFLYNLSDAQIERISDIFPNPHGTITFEWLNSKEEKLSLEIGEENYSYFVIFSNKNPKLVDGQNIFSNIGEITSEINSLVRD